MTIRILAVLGKSRSTVCSFQGRYGGLKKHKKWEFTGTENSYLTTGWLSLGGRGASFSRPSYILPKHYLNFTKETGCLNK